ncbi:MAG: DNA methyltransferase [Nanobdellota archaeon]
MKYLFILGRNIALSTAEIKSYLKRTENNILDEKIIKNGLLLELEKTIEGGAVDVLGGTLEIGIVLCNLKDIIRKEIYYGSDNKFNYMIWDFSDQTERVSEYLKTRFRSERLKTTEKIFTGFVRGKDDDFVRKPSSNLITEGYFVFDDLFGRIIQRCNYKELERRDMEKPVRREELSISPRLAKVMINLSEIKEDGTLLDGFCGIGVILMEAANMGMKVIGIDKDKEAIIGARKNMEWCRFPSKSYTLLNNDSTKIVVGSVDALVSEPDFGEILKRAPNRKEAEHTIKKFENLMIDVFKNMKKSVNGKFVFTSPFIDTGRERIGADISRICEKTGMKLEEGFPIQDFREGQIVGREIVVLKK